MKEELIRVVLCEVGKEARVTTIKNDLKTLQEFVGGYIEAVSIDADIDLICNEEGKLLGLPMNRIVRNCNDKIIDVICGNMLFVSFDDEGEFASLTDEQVKNITEKYIG